MLTVAWFFGPLIKSSKLVNLLLFGFNHAVTITSCFAFSTLKQHVKKLIGENFKKWTNSFPASGISEDNGLPCWSWAFGQLFTFRTIFYPLVLSPNIHLYQTPDGVYLLIILQNWLVYVHTRLNPTKRAWLYWPSSI